MEKDDKKLNATEEEKASGRAAKHHKKGRVAALVSAAADGAETDPESGITHSFREIFQIMDVSLANDSRNEVVKLAIVHNSFTTMSARRPRDSRLSNASTLIPMTAAASILVSS